MCLTCACGEPDKEMGEANITYEDIKRAAEENGLSVAETVAKSGQAVTFDEEQHSQQA